jgi:hypothetical protein
MAGQTTKIILLMPVRFAIVKKGVILGQFCYPVESLFDSLIHAAIALQKYRFAALHFANAPYGICGAKLKIIFFYNNAFTLNFFYEAFQSGVFFVQSQ